MSTSPKIDRKTLKTPDQFVARGTNFLAGFLGHRNLVMGVLGVGLLGVVGYYLMQWKKSSDLDKAWRAYAEAVKSPEPARWDALKKVADANIQTRAGQFAASQVGDHFFDEARKEIFKDEKVVSTNAVQSAEWYSKALSFSGLIPSEKALLLVNRGGSYEMSKKLNEAMKDFEAATQLGAQVKPLAMLSQGRIYEMQDNKAKAIELYEKVSSDFINTEYSKMAKNYIRRLKSPMLAESKS